MSDQETTATALDEPGVEPEDEGLRFDDPYWDDAFCAWWDPALRTCCS